MRTTSHNHSPNQSAPFGQQMQVATEQHRNKKTSSQLCIIGEESEALGFHQETTEKSRNSFV